MEAELTVAQLVPEVLQQISPVSRLTYRPGILRLAERFGDLPLAAVRLPDLERLRDDMGRDVGERTVTRALSSGRRLRSYSPDAFGRGAAENLVRGVRFYFRYAVNAGYLASNPAIELRAPRRHPPAPRPLTEAELVEVWAGALHLSSDPELDALILTFLRHTAARREGCLNLCIDHLLEDVGRVRLTEKGGQTREVPLSRQLIRRLDTFARSRGASYPGDAAFRYRRGTPVTRRRFNVIFDRVDRNCGWTEPLNVGAHWIRHTTLADIAAVSDIRVAAAYAGHDPGELGVIGRYTRVTFEDLADAYNAVFGVDE